MGRGRTYIRMAIPADMRYGGGTKTLTPDDPAATGFSLVATVKQGCGVAPLVKQALTAAGWDVDGRVYKNKKGEPWTKVYARPPIPDDDAEEGE